MRIRTQATASLIFFLGFAGACSRAPKFGTLGEGSTAAPKFVAIDSALPPRSVAVQLPEPAYAALLLVVPGMSATLLYPRDSATSNRLPAGTSTLAFQVPARLVPTDSTGMIRRSRIPRDTSIYGRRPDTARLATGPVPPDALTFLLLVTSPQPLDYGRIREKTTGVSLPIGDVESLNAVAKTVKGTIPEEPRRWAGAYQEITLSNVKR